MVGEGGMSLLLERESFDANAVFGDPYANNTATTAVAGTVSGSGDGFGGVLPSGTGVGSGSTTALGGGSFLPPVSATHTSSSPLVSASSTMYPPAPSLSTTNHSLGGLGLGLPTSAGTGIGAGTGVPPVAATYPYKLLEINLISVGHDSERLTSSVEASTVGNPLNFITGRPSHYLIPVKDDEFGRGRLAESLLFRCNNVLPIIRINSAAYGNLNDVSRLIDVTPEIAGLVKGRELLLAKDVNLVDLFIRDPCPGQQKQLRVDYTVTGFQGNLRLKVDNNILRPSNTLSILYSSGILSQSHFIPSPILLLNVL